MDEDGISQRIVHVAANHRTSSWKGVEGAKDALRSSFFALAYHFFNSKVNEMLCQEVLDMEDRYSRLLFDVIS